MTIRIYNTLSRKKEKFVPKSPGLVTMYVCGPTVYNFIHIGNARVYIFFDVVKRFLETSGLNVIYVSNFTDIDDKIIKKAQEEGISSSEVASKYEEAFLEDIKTLGLLPADIMPRATEHIDGMIEMIKSLIEKGYAYEAAGDVFFSVEKFSSYGKLSGRTIEEMRVGERIDPSPYKKNPLDFVLWKAAKPGEPFWESPWGKGRPGWHIECSVMSSKYLGFGFDIHGGGQDLIFPHHENEIAQSEAAEGRSPFVRYWMHNGLLTFKAEKMAKSVGNIVLLKDVLDEYGPDVLKMFYLSTHYRSPLDYSPERLEEAKSALYRIISCVDATSQVVKHFSEGDVSEKKTKCLFKEIEECKQGFFKAMNDDFNTARALGEIFELVKEINVSIENLRELPEKKVLTKAIDELKYLLSILGIELEREKAREYGGRRMSIDTTPVRILAKELGVSRNTFKEELEELINLREKARAEKDFSTADRIRSVIEKSGYEIKDTPFGARFSIKN